MLLLMLGNGMQGTLLGVRGAIEGYSPSEMSWVMAAYFLGFLGGSKLAPELIRRVGHIRVFAALASFISACLVLYPTFPNLFFWLFLRFVIGFCFSGVYVVAESWLNNSVTNETRGKTLSVYMIVQMIGIVIAQAMLNFADPAGFTLFVVVSVLVSLSVVGSFLLGAVFSGLFGMGAIFGTEKGLSVREISIFIAAIYVGGMIWQYPIGWISDKMDRRVLIIQMTLFAAATIAVGLFFADIFYVLVLIAFVVGGVSNPLYSLYIAYTNDALDNDDMAAASGGLIFVNGIAASTGPLILGWLMTVFGADSFLYFIGGLMLAMGLYAISRMKINPRREVVEASAYTPVTTSVSVIGVSAAQEAAQENAEDEAEAKIPG
jgi:MFS family permease